MIKIALSALVLALLAAAPATAQNLLTNGTFDNNVAGWQECNPGDSILWNSHDADGSSTSGSLQLTFSGAGTATCVHQCVPVTAGMKYVMRAKGFIPSGQSSSVTGTAFLEWQANSCNDYLSSDDFPINSTVDTWVPGSLVGQAPTGAMYADIVLQVADKSHASGVPIVERWDDVFFGPATTTCAADATHLCLTGNRFRVSVEWYDYNNGNVAAAAQAVPFAGETGFFYFKNSANLELMVKVVDACSQPYYHYWFFAAATTDVGYTITVTDTKTGQTETYSNPPHNLSAAVTDQSSFDSCP